MAEKEKRVEYVYAQGANGMTARVPEDRLQEWQKRQDELRQQMKDGSYRPNRARAKELLNVLREGAARAQEQRQG